MCSPSPLIVLPKEKPLKGLPFFVHPYSPPYFFSIFQKKEKINFRKPKIWRSVKDQLTNNFFSLWWGLGLAFMNDSGEKGFHKSAQRDRKNCQLTSRILRNKSPQKYRKKHREIALVWSFGFESGQKLSNVRFFYGIFELETVEHRRLKRNPSFVTHRGFA